QVDGDRADALGRQPLDHCLPDPGPVPGAVDEDHHRCSLHAPILAEMADTARIAEGLALVKGGQGFVAHELFEELWKAAAPAERDLYQGLVHVAVANSQGGAGNAAGR